MMNKILPLVMLFGLTGCISLLPEMEPPPEFIHLDPQFEKAESGGDMQVVVEEPVADLLHNSSKIIIMSPRGQKYKFATGKEWIERMPAFMQRDLVRAITAKGLMGVGTPNKGLKPDYILSGDVNKFLVSTQNPDQPRVEIEADFSLMHMPGRKIVARKTFIGAQASEKGFANILKSFDSVYSDMLNDVSSWVVAKK